MKKIGVKCVKYFIYCNNIILAVNKLLLSQRSNKNFLFNFQCIGFILLGIEVFIYFKYDWFIEGVFQWLLQ